MEEIECSETSAHKISDAGESPKRKNTITVNFIIKGAVLASCYIHTDFMIKPSKFYVFVHLTFAKTNIFNDFSATGIKLSLNDDDDDCVLTTRSFKCSTVRNTSTNWYCFCIRCQKGKLSAKVYPLE